MARTKLWIALTMALWTTPVWGALLIGCAGAEPARFPCGVMVNPDPDVLDAVIESRDRWLSATGCLIEIHTEGIKVHAQAHVFLDDTSGVYDVDPQLQYREVCGVTRRIGDDAKDIFVSRTERGGCKFGEVLTHELGHIWSPAGSHAESGVMAAGKSPMRSDAIDSNTLEWTCKRLDCQAFTPER